MKRHTISKATQQALASEWELYLDGSAENCMAANTGLDDEQGLRVTGSLEAVIEVVAFVALEVGARGDEDEGDDLVNGLVGPRMRALGLNGDVEVVFPHFRVA